MKQLDFHRKYIPHTVNAWRNRPTKKLNVEFNNMLKKVFYIFFLWLFGEYEEMTESQ